MRRAGLWIGVAVLCAALIGWRLLGRNARPAAVPGAGTTPASSVAAGPTAARSVAARTPGPLRLPAAVAERDPAAQRGLFEGRVVSAATGRGIPSAHLTFERSGEASSTTCDAEGRFRFDPPQPGAFSLVLAAAEGYLAIAPAWETSPIVLVARPGERIGGIVIQLTPEVEYLATVKGPDGAPVAGAQVQVLEPERDGLDGTRPVGDSDAKGEVRFVAGDGALVEARHPDFAVGRARIDLGAQAARRIVIRLGPAPTTRLDEALAGTVVDENRLPIAGALVRLSPAETQPGTLAARIDATVQTLSGPDGRFRFEGLDAERYDVQATHAVHAAASEQRVPSGTLDLLLILGRGGRLHGTVAERATGAPVAAFTVVVWSRLGPLEREQVARVTAFDASGLWEVRGIGPGDYVVSVVAAGFAASAEASATMPDPPADVGPLAITLGRGGRVRGEVLEVGTRARLGGARVSLEGRLGPGSGAVPLLAATTTDAEGRFELIGLAEGLRSITVAAADHHARIVSGLVVSEGGEVGPVTVELAPVKDGEEPRLELTGIGAVLSTKDDGLQIGEILPGGGAAQAGLAPGDAILAVDGAAVTEIGFEGAIQRIRGPEGSQVLLSVRKVGGELVELSVVRTRVRS